MWGTYGYLPQLLGATGFTEEYVRLVGWMTVAAVTILGIVLLGAPWGCFCEG